MNGVPEFVDVGPETAMAVVDAPELVEEDVLKPLRTVEAELEAVDLLVELVADRDRVGDVAFESLESMLADRLDRFDFRRHDFVLGED
jgi:hypothetical protein